MKIKLRLFWLDIKIDGKEEPSETRVVVEVIEEASVDLTVTVGRSMSSLIGLKRTEVEM